MAARTLCATLPSEVVDEVERLRGLLQARTPSVRVTTAGVVRWLLIKGARRELADLERRGGIEADWTVEKSRVG